MPYRSWAGAVDDEGPRPRSSDWKVACTIAVGVVVVGPGETPRSIKVARHRNRLLCFHGTSLGERGR